MKKIVKKDLIAWQEAVEKLVEAGKAEMDLRKDICSSILKDKQKGVVHLKKFGLDAAATAKLNVSVSKDDLQGIFKSLSAQEKACIRYKPELIAKNYKELPESSILHKAVTSKPGTPSLTIKPIK